MATKAVKSDLTVEAKLKALYELQKIDSKIDKLRQVRGELPLEVSNLEDDIEGLQTRLNKLREESKEFDREIADRKVKKDEAKAGIKRYEEQQANVRNNREFDSLTKEIEYQNLEIELCDKKIKEATASIKIKGEIIKTTEDKIDDRQNDLDIKKKELEEITSETEKEENSLTSDSEKASGLIDERLFNAYQRVRTNSRNGLAVVNVERDSCGGCFSKIPPQRQLDIKSHKKIIVCESCGRILVDFEEREVAAEPVLRVRPSRTGADTDEE